MGKRQEKLNEALRKQQIAEELLNDVLGYVMRAVASLNENPCGCEDDSDD